MLLLSNNLKTIRQAWNLNQDEMATLLDVTKPAYVAYESGRNEPNLSFVLKLEDLTGITTRQLCLMTLLHVDITMSPLSKNPTQQPSDAPKNKDLSLTPYGQILSDILDRLDKLEKKG